LDTSELITSEQIRKPWGTRCNIFCLHAGQVAPINSAHCWIRTA